MILENEAEVRESFEDAKSKLGQKFWGAHRDGLIFGQLIEVCIYREAFYPKNNDDAISTLIRGGSGVEYRYNILCTLAGPQNHVFVVSDLQNKSEYAARDYGRNDYPTGHVNRYCSVRAWL